MLELKGKYGAAKVFTDLIDEASISQIIGLLNQEFSKDSKVRLMPDVHAGAGCTIGTTMAVTDKICPNLVGVDLGCGMLVYQLTDKKIDFAKLDKVIHEKIPAGFNIRSEVHSHAAPMLNELKELVIYDKINVNRAENSLGTLGGGNHFIEIAQEGHGNYYLVIHTGSRNLGKQVAEYYQELAHKELTTLSDSHKKQIENKIAELKAVGRSSEIFEEINKMKRAFMKTGVPKELSYLTGQSLKDYLHDITIVQKYASLNREIIAREICVNMGFVVLDGFETIHNYIDVKNNILRKGAVSANAGEQLIIPINPAYGSLICVGKGNSDWNNSAPHGAGRLMSRSAAKKNITMQEFESVMSDVYSSTVNQSTLDECPLAYKPAESILENIQDTVDVIKVIKAVYNFKAGE